MKDPGRVLFYTGEQSEQLSRSLRITQAEFKVAAATKIQARVGVVGYFYLSFRFYSVRNTPIGTNGVAKEFIHRKTFYWLVFQQVYVTHSSKSQRTR